VANWNWTTWSERPTVCVNVNFARSLITAPCFSLFFTRVSLPVTPNRLSVPIYLLLNFLYHKLLYSSITSQLDSPINTYIYVPIKMEKNLATYSTSLVTKQLRSGGGANIKRSVGVSPRPRRWSVGNNGIVVS
jgi:hypothetical protein